MYIKKVRKSNRKSNKVYEYLHLVENVRTEKGPRQRLILNLGTLDIDKEQYKELAYCIEAQLTGQRQLFSNDPKVEKYARKAAGSIIAKQSQHVDIENENDQSGQQPYYRNVDIASLQAGEARSIGAEYVCHSIWNELNYIPRSSR
jgi:hypothetical protein